MRRGIRSLQGPMLFRVGLLALLGLVQLGHVCADLASETANPVTAGLIQPAARSISSMKRRLAWDIIPDYLEDAAAFAESEYVDLTEIGLALAACLIVGVGCVLGFSCLRRKYDCYEPRRVVQPDKTLPAVNKESLLGWVWPLLCISEEDMLRTAGLDAVVHVRSYLLALRIFTLFSAYGFLVILPLNYWGGERETGHSTLNDFDWFSMSNVQTGSPRLWAHVLGMFVLTAICMLELRWEWQSFIELRHQHLLQHDAHLRAVLVEKIPRELRSRSKLTAYFQSLYPDDVAKVVLCQDLRSLDMAVTCRDNALAWLERYLRIKEITGKEPHHTELTSGCERVESIPYYQRRLQYWNEQVGREQARARALARRSDQRSSQPQSPHLQRLMQLHHSNRREEDEDDESDEEEGGGVDKDLMIGEGRFAWLMEWGEGLRRVLKSWVLAVFAEDSSAEEEGEKVGLLKKGEEEGRRVVLSKAFVVFKSYTAATLAQQVVHAATPGSLVIQPCPQPHDMLWRNLYVTRTSRTYRSVIIEVVVVLLLMVYVVPVTLIALLVSPDNLASRFAWVASLSSRHVWFQILLAAIQPCCLFMLMTTLPPLFFVCGMAEGQLSMSSIVKSTFARYYAFQVVNVFLVTTIAGSVLDSLYDILNDPSQTFYLLGQSLPKVGGFFCEYMFLKAFASLPLELSRFVQYMQSFIKKHVLWHLTIREKRAEVLGSRDFMKPYWFNYGKYLAQDQLGVLVAMTYSVISPLILVPCLCFFAMAVLVYKHQLLYSYETSWQTGGEFWPRIFNRYLFAIFLGQSTLIGVLALKGGYLQCYMVGLLMIATAAYTIIMHEVYMPAARNLPLEIAKSVDHWHEKGGEGGEWEYNAVDAFLQPSMRATVEAVPEAQPPVGELYETEAPKREEGYEAGCLGVC